MAVQIDDGLAGLKSVRPGCRRRSPGRTGPRGTAASSRAASGRRIESPRRTASSPHRGRRRRSRRECRRRRWSPCHVSRPGRWRSQTAQRTSAALPDRRALATSSRPETRSGRRQRLTRDRQPVAGLEPGHGELARIEERGRERRLPSVGLGAGAGSSPGSLRETDSGSLPRPTQTRSREPTRTRSRATAHRPARRPRRQAGPSRPPHRSGRSASSGPRSRWLSSRRSRRRPSASVPPSGPVSRSAAASSVSAARSSAHRISRSSGPRPLDRRPAEVRRRPR